MLGVGGVEELAYGTAPDGRIVVSLRPEGVTERMSTLVSQSIEVIRNRIDELGTTEPQIQRQGADRILVQVPGFDDSSRLKSIISQTARLTFHMVDDSMSAAQARAQGLPPGTIVLPSESGGEELLNEEIALGGESLTNAQPGFDSQTGQSVVNFQLDTRGAVTFGDITSHNVGRRFAIVLDENVITAPTIRSAITQGSGQISGSFTPESANDLAVLLRAGALPASLDIIEERSVGPSLGADSVRGGVIAGVIGAIGVVVFMVVAYGKFGLFGEHCAGAERVHDSWRAVAAGGDADASGIAGIVLTIGMSVDANVLIYERMREERASGRSVVASIESGYARALGDDL